MLAWIWKKLEQLLDTLVDPLWKRVLALSWAGRLTILVFCAATLAVGLHWKDTQHFLTTGAQIVAVTLHSGHNGMPLSDNYQRRVKGGIERLAASLEADLSSRNYSLEGSWAPAQVVIALKGISLPQPETLATFFHSRADPACSCWKEFPESQAPRHILVSGYVLFALAHLNSPASSDQVRFMLGVQSGEGWWPMYPSAGRPDNASTYATAFSLLALNEHLNRKLISPEQDDEVKDAIMRGSSWLVKNRASGQARWWDYPLSSNRKVSEGLSGLVIYTLLRLGRTTNFLLDRQWLAELPESLPSADACEIRVVWTETLDGRQADHSCKITLAWLLLATANAYPNGSRMQKAKAVTWVKRVLDETNILHSETLPENWKRAEILNSLKHLVSTQKK
jgi:hypothetical protein